ncbi:MAG: ArsA family ATPase [Deltaproteobacteria bacterium]|nr:ArsA family ATPase [Deltaproteobacteria bacterium]MBW2209863.1 ArsA family ATPase [Deltaproteobacteria bacterium]MBW2213000.1 ArsA family ATPase [Deltaproteobacteria bacterium]MBW2379113.1 ArsA family ATPase [Deltaproteobacteria bacterium]MBW2626456.1 ArsA family ATPase [Deltaproteobacteria bacterium]
MDLLDRRFLFVVGKGGVGKTTVATGLALAASRRDKKVLLALVNCKERVSQLLNTEPIGSEIVTVAENLDVVNMTPDAALEEYGVMILKVKAVFNAVFKNRLVRAFLKGTPGLEAWSMLGKAFYHACPPKGEPDYDLVIVDAPATGHALDMLRVPFVIESVAPPGLLRRDAARAAKMFRDPERAGAVLVTLPEYMPASETIELSNALANELRIPVLHLVINRVLNVLFAEKERPVLESLPSQIPDDSEIRGLALAGKRRALRETVQARAVRRVCSHIDAPCSELPYYSGLESDTAAIEALSEALLRTV